MLGYQEKKLKILPYKIYLKKHFMKNILLAGGAGYIGTELCKRLLRLDYKVTVIDELWFGNNLDPKVELIKKDLFQVTHKDL